MISWLITLSPSEQWAIGIAALFVIGIVSQWVGQRLNYGLALEAKPMMEEWFRKASEVTAITFPAVRQTFGSADYVDGFTIFDVGGNRYRIVAVIHYDKQRMYIREVMTHAEYDRNKWRKR